MSEIVVTPESDLEVLFQKHTKEMKPCSWAAWAKKHAPAQYREHKKGLWEIPTIRRIKK